MSKICDLCGKSYLKGNLVPRGIGDRVVRRTISRQQPNLRTKRIKIGPNSIKLKMCSGCLKRMHKDMAQMSEAQVVSKTVGKTA